MRLFLTVETRWLVGGTRIDVAGGVAARFILMVFVQYEYGVKEDGTMMPLKFNSKRGVECTDSKHGSIPALLNSIGNGTDADDTSHIYAEWNGNGNRRLEPQL